jgi:hypothetical protein
MRALVIGGYGVDQPWHRQAPAGPGGRGEGFQPRQVRRPAILADVRTVLGNRDDADALSASCRHPRGHDADAPPHQ